MPETPHLTYRLTDEREEKIDRLRQHLTASRLDGTRIHGVLTTAQILDWSLDALLAQFENMIVTTGNTAGAFIPR